MRASELIGLHVYDRDGVHIGDVHDMRVAREVFGDREERLRVDGIVVGFASVGVRLGYTFGETRGPWTLRKLLTRSSRAVRIVPWQHLVRRDKDALHLDAPVSALPREDLS